MEKFVYSLGLIVLGLAVGKALKLLVDRNIIDKSFKVEKHLKYIQRVTLLLLYPIITMGAFWIFRMTDIRLAVLPLLGVCALTIGGALGIAGAKILKLGKSQTGSLFALGTLTNLGSFGSLICYFFFGETSYVFVSMYRLFEEIITFCIVYPITKMYGSHNNKEEKSNISRIFKDPFIIVSVTSIIIGSILNLSGMQRPEAFTTINAVLIPAASFLLVTTTGFYMKFSAVNKYVKESLIISAIKFLIIPAIITSAAYFLGLGEISNGLALKVVFILSSMPPAFTALIPPQLYNLDLDLANSCWLFNSAALVIVLPIIFLIEGGV